MIELEEFEANAQLERRWQEQQEGDGPNAQTLLSALQQFGPPADDAKPKADGEKAAGAKAEEAKPRFNEDQTHATLLHGQEIDTTGVTEG